MKRPHVRFFVLYSLIVLVLSLAGCQTTTIKKIYYNDEPLFEYPHIVESDRIWIEDDPEVFYSFVRSLKDFLYEDAQRARFFVKRDEAVYMLWLIPIQQDETTIYELRIERPMLAYGEAVAGGGWIKQYGEFPFPVHLLDNQSSAEPNLLPVAFESLLEFYSHVTSAVVKAALEWITIDVGSAVVLLQKDGEDVSIRWLEHTAQSDAANALKSVDLSFFALASAKRFDGIAEDAPVYADVTPDPDLLMAQLILLQASSAWGNAAVMSEPTIPSHQFEWTFEDQSFVLRYAHEDGVSFVTLKRQGGTAPDVTLTFETQGVEGILEAIDALIVPTAG